jgi:hypothetical protein
MHIKEMTAMEYVCYELVRVCTCVCMRMCVNVSMYVCMHAPMHMYIYIQGEPISNCVGNLSQPDILAGPVKYASILL